jgi:hypothetical protein
MKRSPGPSLSLSLQGLTKAPPPSLVDVAMGPKRVQGMSRWHALDRKRFAALIASPVRKDAPEGGPTSC